MTTLRGISLACTFTTALACSSSDDGTSGSGGAGGTAAAAGTGGTSAAGTGGSAGMPGAPQIAIRFPPPSGTTAEQLHVRGTAASTASIASVSVAGVPATSDDGFATWTALVPLELGEQVLLAEVVDDSGEDAEASVAVQRWADESEAERGSGERSGAIFGSIALSADASTLYYSDNFYDELSLIEVSTSVRRTIAGDGNGGPAGEQITGPAELIPSPDGGTLWFTDPGEGRILRADVAARTWDFVADESHGSGPLSTPFAIAVDGEDLLVLERNLSDSDITLEPALLRVNPASGDRTFIAHESVGNEPMPRLVVDMVFDADRRAAWVSEQYTDVLWQFDVDSGARSIVVDGTGGGGAPELKEWTELGWHAPSARVVSYASDPPALFAFAPDEGGIQVLSSAERGSGLLPLAARSVDAGEHWIVVVDDTGSLTRVHAVDPVSGDRVLLHVMQSLSE